MDNKEFNMKTHLLDEIDREELARQVREGYSSGRLDTGDGKHIYYELKVNVWND